MSLISRRSLLTSGAAAGVLAASGMGLSAATPKRGGTLRAALSGGSVLDSWDTRTHDSLFMMAAAHGAVFDCLTEIGPDGALRGELAKSWEASVDAKVWTFDLQSDATFHNGKPFVAQDVIESFALHMQAVGVSPAEPLLRDVIHIREVTPHQVQFVLAAPNADFPYLVSDYHLVIYPSGYVELAQQNGVGTGLYRVENFEPGVHLRATRVASHYKGDKAGFFDEIDLWNEPNSAARVNGLLEGALDVSAQLSPAHALQVEGMRSLSLQSLSGNQHYCFAVIGDVSWTDLDAVRAAVKHAIDRSEFVDETLLGFGRIGADTPVGPANPYFAENLSGLEFDPTRARSLLSKAGVDHLRVQVSSEGAGAVSLFKRQMARVGLRVEIVTADAHAHLQSTAGRATEDWAISTFLAPGAMWNRCGWQDPQFGRTLAAARSEMDTAKRKTHYIDLQERVRSHSGLVVPAFMNHLQAHSSSIAVPAKIGAHYAMDNARFAERWWRA
ncbi:ABC transporter substrate-binding protein [Shimia sp.]|uniref:ABC transporter substrate-binding protein n=1 Tax=Shimia sp. TaxID=1954381 RepID=UPI003B8DDB78